MERFDPRSSAFMVSDDGPCPGDCSSADKLGFRFSYAFQPIVDVLSKTIFGHEALVRGEAGEPAMTILSQVNDTNRYRFDQACRVKAIKTASQLGMTGKLSINFLPNAIYRPEVCIATTLAAATEYDFPIERIIFETVEGERIADAKWLTEVFEEYRRTGFTTAIDDFGAGFAGLSLLADFQPDILKLDMLLVRSIHQSKARQAIVRATSNMSKELGVAVLAEGVETLEEKNCLIDMGVSLMQGYYFSKPIFEGWANDPSKLGL